MTTQQTLQQALQHHQSGQWIEAHRLYKQVLAIEPDQPDALHLLGQLVFASGDSAAAEKLITRAIELHPKSPDYHADLARIYFFRSEFDNAIDSFTKATELDPASSQLHFELARALAATAKNTEAIHHVELSIQINPTADAIGLLGGLLLATGKVQQAIDHLHKATTIAPDRADLHSTYAMALQQRGDFELAEKTFREAADLQPDFAQIRNHLGYLLVLRRKLPEAIVELRRAIELQPNYPQAHYHLALAFTGQGQTDDALASYRTALAQDPTMPDAWESLGRVLLDLRQYPSAITAFTRAVALRPTSQLYILLGIAHGGVEDLDSAIAATQKAVELEPNSADAHDALGGELKWTGQLDLAIEQFRQALKINPKHQSAHSKLVYATLMQDGPTPAEILAVHKQWGDQQTGSIEPFRRPGNLKMPGRRLRIGYISNNFRKQAVSSFTLPILQHHDRNVVEIFCYSDLEIPDSTTRRFQTYANHWRQTSAANDEQLAKKIREDRIDILVELTGHIGKGRLAALAYRPAPVQVSYIGYQGTTGVSAVDYVLTDDWADPPGAEKNYVETTFRLPGSFFVYEPPPDAPMVGPLPAVRTGHVTFGCQNAISKVTPRTLALWSQVMNAVRNSRLILLTTRCAKTNDKLLAGLPAGRVQLVQRTGTTEYFRRYNTIDIALDPVPFNGHTTTCDAAWMGCPTVTLSGQIYAHRYGGSVLRNLNLADLAVETDEAYLAVTTALANNLARLKEIRSTLRSTMQQSLITNGPQFTRNLEHAYRTMWDTWCRSTNEPTVPSPGTPEEG